jgi:hypothetical protein
MDLAAAAAEARSRPRPPTPPPVQAPPPQPLSWRVKLLAAGAGALIWLLCWYAFGGDGSYRTERIDLRSGRLLASGRTPDGKDYAVVQESVISRVLPPLPASHQPDTEAVSHPARRGRHSAGIPTFGGVKTDLVTLESHWKHVPFTDAAKQQVAREVLRLWQAHRDPEPARRYIDEVVRVTRKATTQRPGTVITPAELPSAQTQTRPTRGG